MIRVPTDGCQTAECLFSSFGSVHTGSHGACLFRACTYARSWSWRKQNVSCQENEDQRLFRLSLLRELSCNDQGRCSERTTLPDQLWAHSVGVRILIFLLLCFALLPVRMSGHRVPGRRTPFVLAGTGGAADGLDDQLGGGRRSILRAALLVSRLSPLPMTRVVAGWGSNLMFDPSRLSSVACAVPPVLSWVPFLSRRP
jgi:hypothetical protein